MERVFNLQFSQPSAKDWYFTSIVRSVGNLPKSYSLEKYCGNIKDQGEAGLCHSFAGAAVKDIQERMETGIKYNLSPLFLAKNVKAIDGIDEEGSTLPYVCKALYNEGTVKEIYYPFEQYVAGSLSFPDFTHSKAHKFKIGNYARCDTLDSMKQAISMNKPVLLGVTCCKNIYDLNNNASKFIPIPQGFIAGGHAIVVIGYDDELTHTYPNGKTCTGFFRIQNSWGEDWGDGGFAWMPYEYLTYKVNVIGEHYFTFFSEAWATVDLKNDDIKTTTIVMQINNKEVKIDGKKKVWDQAPIIDKVSERTLVPLRSIAEALEFTVEWDDKDKTITICKELE